MHRVGMVVRRCRKRYAIFKTHYAATLRLKNYFPFTLIDAMGSIEETRQQITKELRWVQQQHVLVYVGVGVLGDGSRAHKVKRQCMPIVFFYSMCTTSMRSTHEVKARN